MVYIYENCLVEENIFAIRAVSVNGGLKREEVFSFVLIRIILLINGK